MHLYYYLSLFKYLLVLPHIFICCLLDSITKKRIYEDVQEMNIRNGISKKLAYYLIFEKPYRNVYYYRVGKWAKYLQLFLSPYDGFYIAGCKEIGGGIYVLNHPYGTIINCKKIGNHFTICQLTTIGNKQHGRNDLTPVIGDNVSLGANVNIMGNITIGNNVIVGAGSVVVKDVPDNCIVAGNPAKIIRYLAKQEI